jgi:hypothetical protein
MKATTITPNSICGKELALKEPIKQKDPHDEIICNNHLTWVFESCNCGQHYLDAYVVPDRRVAQHTKEAK